MWNAIKRLSRMYFNIFVHTHTHIYIDIAIIKKLESGGDCGRDSRESFWEGMEGEKGKTGIFLISIKHILKYTRESYKWVTWHLSFNTGLLNNT